MKEHQEQQSSTDLAVEQISDALKDTRIGLCIGGGIAAIEAPRLIRELRRYGAQVTVYATETALRFIGRDSLEWACGRPIVVSGSGLADHIAQDDLALIFPATTDLIGKAAHGICPDACTTYIQSALGSRKLLLILPTMHDSLRCSPAFQANMRILSDFENVEFLEPRKSEGKWKSPSPEEIALEIAFRFNRKKHEKGAGKVLVTLGGTITPIDSARVITNLSSGTLGALLVRQLLERGVHVCALCASHTAQLPVCTGADYINLPKFSDFHEWLAQDKNTKQFSAIFHLAAVSDYAPSRELPSKIDSAKAQLELELLPVPKLIKLPTVRKIPFKMACKYTDSDTKTSKQKALHLLNDNKLDMVFWNWGQESFGKALATTGILILQDDEKHVVVESKKQIAALLVEKFLNRTSK